MIIIIIIISFFFFFFFMIRSRFLLFIAIDRFQLLRLVLLAEVHEKHIECIAPPEASCVM